MPRRHKSPERRYGPQQNRRFSVAHDQIDFAAALAHVGGDKTAVLAFQPATRGKLPHASPACLRVSWREHPCWYLLTITSSLLITQSGLAVNAPVLPLISNPAPDASAKVVRQRPCIHAHGAHPRQRISRYVQRFSACRINGTLPPASIGISLYCKPSISRDGSQPRRLRAAELGA